MSRASLATGSGGGGLWCGSETDSWPLSVFSKSVKWGTCIKVKYSCTKKFKVVVMLARRKALQRQQCFSPLVLLSVLAVVPLPPNTAETAVFLPAGVTVSVSRCPTASKHSHSPNFGQEVVTFQWLFLPLHCGKCRYLSLQHIAAAPLVRQFCCTASKLYITEVLPVPCLDHAVSICVTTSQVGAAVFLITQK